MKKLIIAPLSTPKTVTLAVMDAICNADKLYLQTALHPCAKPVKDSGRDYITMDDLYDEAEDFSALNIAIAERLTGGDSCVYAVMGDGCFSQMPEIERLCNERGFLLTVLPAVSYAKAAFTRYQQGTVYTANALPKRLYTDYELYIEELDDALLASDVKLALNDYYPDEHKVTLASLRDDGQYSYQTMPLYKLDGVRGLNAASVLYVPPIAFEDKTRYGYYDVVDVMERLRAKDGCPWDREQTHESLKRALLEECYELLEAIDQKDDEHMIEELGDVLMQVVFHSTIAKEQYRFNEHDVSDTLAKKLVFRHPHIFGDVKANTSDEVLTVWDAQKRQEKHQTTQTEVLRSVPKNFPALIRCQKVQKKASKIGFDWKCAQDAFYKLSEEIEELRLAINKGEGIEDELSDVYFSLVNITRLLGLDSEDIANIATNKFIARFDTMEQLAKRDGQDIANLTTEMQDMYWEMAKNQGN